MKRAFLLFASLGILGPACDCEDTIRKKVSDRPAEAKPVEVPTESSAPSETEPNDSAESATRIEIHKELRPLKAELGTVSDVDWFAISGMSGAYEITVQPSSELDISLHLAGTQFSIPASTYNVGGVGEQESIPLVFLNEGEVVYFALRSVGSGSGPYEIRLMRRIVSGGLEAEPNDRRENANELKIGGQVQGMFDRSDDRDFYRIPSSDTDRYFQVELTPASNLTQKFRVYGSDSTTKLVELTVGQEPLRIPAFKQAAGEELWLKLKTESGFDIKSMYTLSLVDLKEVAPDVELEPNDIAPQVFGIPAEVRGKLFYAGDIDRLGFGKPLEEAAKPPTVEGERQRWDSISNVEVRAVSQSKLEVSIITSKGSAELGVEAEGTAWNACGLSFRPGELEISIKAKEYVTTSDLDYHVKVSDLSQIEGFEWEPNNSVDEAEEMFGVRRGVIESAQTSDYYSFEVFDELETLDLGLSPSETNFELLDSAGARVAAGNQGKIQVDLPKGKYFVRVFSAKIGECPIYSLEVDPPRVPLVEPPKETEGLAPVLEGEKSP